MDADRPPPAGTNGGRTPAGGASARGALLVAAAAVAAFANSLRGGFVYDDIDLIVNNPWLRSFDGLLPAFSSSARGFYADLPVSNYYRPLTHLFNMLVFRAAGPAPLAFHLASVALHATACVLVFLLASRLMAETRGGGPDPGGRVPLATGLLFALHPVHVENVAWVAGAPDLLVACLGLLSLFAYLGLPAPSAGWRRASGVSLGAFLLATLSKEAAVVLPLLFLGFDVLVRGESLRRPGPLAGRYAPYAIVVGVSLALRLRALGGLAPEGSGLAPDAGTQAAGMVQALAWDLWRMVLPFGYTLCSELVLTDRPLLHPLTVGAALSLLGWGWCWHRISRREPLLRWAGLAFLVPLVPVLIPVTSLKMPMADRYLYLSSFGFCLTLAHLCCAGPRRARALPPGRTVIFALVPLVLAAATVHRNRIFQDEHTLWSHVSRRLPNLPWPKNLVAGEPAPPPLDRGVLDDAVAQRRFGYSAARNYRLVASLLLEKGRREDALPYLELLLSLEPGDAWAKARLRERPGDPPRD